MQTGIGIVTFIVTLPSVALGRLHSLCVAEVELAEVNHHHDGVLVTEMLHKHNARGPDVQLHIPRLAFVLKQIQPVTTVQRGARLVC